ncbi:hypothetical protein [Vibrio phage vB_VmeM-Yong XC32]|nr:hypothetical protein [Vibrio phage vB_VmeM-Yong XC31]QAX96600.1 hypothetical protein [Vibrio phage vB_VmeM-Yong XC32]QAX96918.1 hypothetical protein [Vibrio phage vB_VmeM-Yong MS31]QAX97223.1 hypothetical protein [Vibrio phage vB_VmeM-Yong MS32]
MDYYEEIKKYEELLRENPELVDMLANGYENAFRSAFANIMDEQRDGEAVIFLDVDEVVQTERAHLMGLRIDPYAVGLINRLAKEYNARIVYVSVWKSHMKTLLAASKLHEAFGFSSITLRNKGEGEPWRIEERYGTELSSREQGVDDYLRENPSIKRWVVIDDSVSDYFKYLDQAVCPDPVEGFGVRDYYRARYILRHGSLEGFDENQRESSYIWAMSTKGAIAQMPSWDEVAEQRIKEMREK